MCVDLAVSVLCAGNRYGYVLLKARLPRWSAIAKRMPIPMSKDPKSLSSHTDAARCERKSAIARLAINTNAVSTTMGTKITSNPSPMVWSGTWPSTGSTNCGRNAKKNSHFGVENIDPHALPKRLPGADALQAIT